MQKSCRDEPEPCRYCGQIFIQSKNYALFDETLKDNLLSITKILRIVTYPLRGNAGSLHFKCP